MATAQDHINKIRIQLGETDALNSRWQDPVHLLFYLNQGRREWAKQSQAIKNIFEQTSAQGVTVAGQNRFARYILDPLVWEIDNIYWDGFEVEPIGTNEWEEAIGHREPSEQGVSRVYRRIGFSIDLFPAPNDKKTLEIHASILPEDLAVLTSPDNDFRDDQAQGAIDYATAMALFDDDRDGNFYLTKFQASIKRYKKLVHYKGPRFVNQMDETRWPT